MPTVQFEDENNVKIKIFYFVPNMMPQVIDTTYRKYPKD